MPRIHQADRALFQYLVDMIEMPAGQGEHKFHTQVDQGAGGGFASIGSLHDFLLCWGRDVAA